MVKLLRRGQSVALVVLPQIKAAGNVADLHSGSARINRLIRGDVGL
jgi:hypothetical protein